jgi:hypothetical protein
MDRKEIETTPLWTLYERGQDYHRRTGIYTDTDRNYRFFNGNQWEGAKLGGVEPIQMNFIAPIVKYKIAVIHDNLYAVVYESMNFENTALRKQTERLCKMLNAYAARVWERDGMDRKSRRVTRDSAVNGEGILFVDFDKESMLPVNEIIKKNDVYYGNENDDNIETQPYILITKRLPVVNAVDLALRYGVSKAKTALILGDSDTSNESGDAAKMEMDNMVTVVHKLYKKDGTVRFSVATKLVEIANDIDLGISRYPVVHFNWEDVEGSSRGEGEVRHLIPTQIEVNRICMRRALTVKNEAYPTRVVDKGRITNPDALKTTGAILTTNSKGVEDVRKLVAVIPPASMSSDVKQLEDDLIQVSRELAGAGEVATGGVDPSSSSGRAILAVQQAQREPITWQSEAYKATVEDLAKIWLDYLIVHSADGVQLEEEVTTPNGEKFIQLVTVPQKALKDLRATVKIDVTPKSVYDRLAVEQALENFLLNGFFSAQRLGELKAYVHALPDDATAPKQILITVIESIEEEERKIALLETQAQMMQQRASQYINADPESQADQLTNAAMQVRAARARSETEEQAAKEDLNREKKKLNN